MTIFHRTSVLFAAAAVIHCGGCTKPPSNSDGGVDAGPTIGSLVVFVNGPNGSTANVTVTGPGGYSKALTQTTTLSVPTGSYSVTASNTSIVQPTGPANIEDGASVSGSPASVSTNAIAIVTVTYQALPGTGMLWVPIRDSHQWVAYDSASVSLGANAGFAIPRVTLEFDGGQRPEAVAFDLSGNLWGIESGHTVISVPAAQLGVDAVLAPPLVIFGTTFDAGLGVLSSTLSNPVSMAFDHQGDLWIGNCGSSGALVEYGPGQLASAGGALIPINTFLSPLIDCVSGIAFDGAGDLWVSTTGPQAGILKFPLAGLLDGGMTPDVFIVDDGGLSPLALTRPENLAFDKNGDIWATNCNLGGIYFVAHFQASTGWSAQDTLLDVGADGGVARCPTGIAFDSQSNLWVAADTSPGSLLVYTPDQLSRGLFVDGGPVAAATFPLPGLIDFCGVAMNPAPQGLPLAH